MKKKSTILGIVLGALLVLGGIYLIYSDIVTVVAEVKRVSGFHAVDAYVVDARVVNNNHHDGPSYKLAVRYRYAFNGQTYVGDRVWLKDIQDADPTWPYSWLAILTDAKKSNQPITVYVNPELPLDAILDRTLRRDRIAGTVFLALFFSGSGLFVIYKMLTVKIRDTNEVLAPAEREQMVMRTSFETKYGSMIVLVVVVLVVTAIFLNYSRNVRVSNRQEERVVYAPLAMDEQVGDYNVTRSVPGMTVPLPNTFPEGAATPAFCKFTEAKSSELYAEYTLHGTMELGIYQAGDRINAHMVKSRWKPYDFIKQSDAVVMIYTDGHVELSYMFLDNIDKSNDCHIIWRPVKTLE